VYRSTDPIGTQHSTDSKNNFRDTYRIVVEWPTVVPPSGTPSN